MKYADNIKQGLDFQFASWGQVQGQDQGAESKVGITTWINTGWEMPAKVAAPLKGMTFGNGPQVGRHKWQFSGEKAKNV